MTLTAKETAQLEAQAARIRALVEALGGLRRKWHVFRGHTGRAEVCKRDECSAAAALKEEGRE